MRRAKLIGNSTWLVAVEAANVHVYLRFRHHAADYCCGALDKHCRRHTMPPGVTHTGLHVLVLSTHRVGTLSLLMGLSLLVVE